MCLALLCLMIFPLLVSCTPDASGDTDVTTPGADVTTDGNATEEGGDLKLVGGQNEYTILRPDSLSALYELEAAIILKNAIQSACAGNKIKIATDYKTNPVSDYEICVGEVARNGSAYNVDTSSLKSNEFIVKVCGTRIVIVGYTGYGTQKAVEWFVSQYLNVEEGALTSLSIPADFEYVGSFDFSNNIRIMTQNLLATDTEYEGYVKQDEWADRILVDLSQHTLAKRQPRILALIEKYAPDSLGVQECSASWRSYFDKKLSTIGYKFIGASKNGKIGIVYNTETLTLIEDGSVWLTEKPNSLKISKEWTNGSDGISERLAMYAVFEVNATGKRYIHFNTHIDTKKNEIIHIDWM